jgi:ubiquinone/menaquinone biosynthesis C-methylase UbiE/DNA-binding transcriptional ArsR family regulator
MEELLAGLRAVAETTRLRLLFVLSHGEFNVSELTQILGQSQPRVSRHLKLMAEAGLLSRYKEGSWVLFRLREQAVGGALARAIVDLLPANDPLLASDIARLEEVRRQRSEAAAAYFRANAANWENLRSLHIREEDVEAALLRIAGSAPLGTYLDLGTGTGRVLKLFAPQAQRAIGVDSSREMLAVARANLDPVRNRGIEVRQGDIYALPYPNGSADFVTIHQVLHYLDEPGRALIEAARVLKPGGRLMIVDFAPHDLEQLRELHAHRRLGIAGDLMSGWLERAGLNLEECEVLPPPARNGEHGLTVSIWLASRPPQGAAPAKNRAVAVAG